MTIRLRLAVLLVTAVSLLAPPAQASLTLRCNWGVGANAPAVFPNSTQVIATPVVLNFGVPGGLAQIAFISFENNAQGNRDGGGVLRLMNPQCHEIARFPDTACTYPAIPNAPPGFTTTPDLAPLSGIAAANITNGVGNAAIIAVVGGPTSNHRQIAAFNVVGNCIMPLWVSSATALPAGDFIPISAPAIAQLDRPPAPPGWQNAEIVIDNKVFNANGTLRYTGFNGGGNNCATAPGGSPCPRSRTIIVANVMGQALPQLITGRGIYASTSPTMWTGPVSSPPIIVPPITNGPLVYPAIAELDPNSPGPEIVVVDTMTSKLYVLSSTGAVRASASIPSPPATSPRCGGPPMIGDAGGLAGPEIGVASCTRYTLFHYNVGVQTLTPVWSMPTHDAGGQTTSTLYNGPTPRIVYPDESTLWVFNATTGAVIQSLPQNSATAIEGPVIASLDTGHPEPTCHMGSGNLIVVSNNIWGGTQKGVRILNDPDIGMVASCWNQHSFHVTNLGNSYGVIPLFEVPSWTGLPARNTFRVQRWP